MTGPKAFLTEFGIHHILESCGKSKCVYRRPEMAGYSFVEAPFTSEGDNVDKGRKQGLCNHVK